LFICAYIKYNPQIIKAFSLIAGDTKPAKPEILFANWKMT